MRDHNNTLYTCMCTRTASQHADFVSAHTRDSKEGYVEGLNKDGSIQATPYQAGVSAGQQTVSAGSVQAACALMD